MLWLVFAVKYVRFWSSRQDSLPLGEQNELGRIGHPFSRVLSVSIPRCSEDVLFLQHISSLPSPYVFFSFNFSHTSKCKSVQASVQWILIRYTKGKKFKRHTTSLQQLLWRVITDLRRHVRVCVCCYVELSSKAGKYLLASFFALLLLPLVLVKIRSRGSLTKNQTYCSGIPPLRPCLEVRSEKHKI